MLQASPTYASVEILRSHRRKVKQKVPIPRKDTKKPFPIISKGDDVKVLAEVASEGKVSEPFLERKLQTNETIDVDTIQDISSNEPIEESSTEISLLDGIDDSTSLEHEITTTLTSLIDEE